LCGKTSNLVCKSLSVCLDCIRERFSSVSERIMGVHADARVEFGLPVTPPQSIRGISCTLCSNRCTMGEGERGYCGVRWNAGHRLEQRLGSLDWYYDPLPTNCVADWICAGGSSSGFPEYSYSRGAEFGYKNLAVFYRACSLNCLFCQNWHFRQPTHHSPISPSELAKAVDDTTSCICYFGGDPTPQLPHAIETSRLAREQNPNRILRICWETNGTMDKGSLESMIGLSLESGGCLKFDLKAFSPHVHVALCGVDNVRTLENFEYTASFLRRRRDPPLLVASTLLVPGYVDLEEVRQFARFRRKRGL